MTFSLIDQKNDRRGAKSSIDIPVATPVRKYSNPSGFLHVVAGDADAVVQRHVAAGVAEDVADDPHARCRRIDEGVADHELLQDVILDGPGQFRLRDPLFLRCDDIHRQDWQHSAVHRH
jgi:hypothetical protein